MTCALLRLLQMEPGSGEQATLFFTLPRSPHFSVILSDVNNAKSIILRIFKNVRARRDSRAICATTSFHSLEDEGPERFQAEGFAQDICLVWGKLNLASKFPDPWPSSVHDLTGPLISFDLGMMAVNTETLVLLKSLGGESY